MANPRSRARIEARIHERIAHCVEFELNDPRAAFITIMGVEVTSDLGQAKIKYSVLGSKGDRTKAAHMLEDASGFIRKQMGRVLETRRVPEVRWYYDDSAEIASQVQQAISDAMTHDRAVNPTAHEELLNSPPPGEDTEETAQGDLDEPDAGDDEGEI